MDSIISSERRLERQGVKDLLILQYTLHEVEYHAQDTGTGPPGIALVPKAHTLADIYKCLHQGIFGVGHSISDWREFKRHLADELGRAEASFTEPLMENVSPDGAVFRINLRPFRMVFMDEEERGCGLLLGVCLESAAKETGTTAEFFSALELFRDLNQSGELVAGGRFFSFPEQTVNSFLQEILKLVSSSGLVPVLSHSPIYRSLNHPSYRVVQLKALMSSPLAFLAQTPS